MPSILPRLEALIFPPVCPACRAEPPTEDTAASRLCHDCNHLLTPMPAPRCKACGGIIDGILDVCGECAANPCRSWDHAVSVYAYGGYVRHLIHRFKYRKATALAPGFATAMAENLANHGKDRPDAIVPVPMHWFRQIHRGYNQAEILARLIGKRTGIPVINPLKRRRNNVRQATLDLDTRRRNVKDVFSPKGKTNLKGYHIVLVDDVLTTGATLDAATAALKEAGAAYVEVLTLARG